MRNRVDLIADPVPPGPRPPQWLRDLVIITAVVLIALAPIPREGPWPASIPLVILLMLPAGLIQLRRRAPMPVLIGCVIIFGVAVSTGTLAPGVVLAIAVAAYNVADRLNRRDTLLVGAATVLVVALLSLLVALRASFDLRVLLFSVIVAFGVAAGDANRSRREFVTAATERAERAEQTRESEVQRGVIEERLRIARDLHDVVAHQISVISLNAGVASSALESQPDKARQALGVIRGASRTALRDIGDLMRYLRASEGDSGGDGVPAQPGLNQLSELLRGFDDTGLRVTLRTEGDVSRLTGLIDVVAFRVVQEGLTNAHKHGADHRAHVLVAVSGPQVEIVISNPVDDTLRSDGFTVGGYGLLGLRERVASVGGTFEAGPSSAGYRLAVSLLLPSALAS